MSIQTALSDLLDDLEIKREVVVFRRKGKVVYIRCPFHWAEKTPSFRILPDLSYYCFGCGDEGNCRDDLEAIKDGIRNHRPWELMSAEEWRSRAIAKMNPDNDLFPSDFPFI